VSFEVRRGEVLGIIGRNGAGKSTLLKILAHIAEPTRGRVTIRGRVSALLEVGTGFHPELTGRENIYLNGTILGMRKAEIDRKFDEIVDFSGVERFIDTPVKRYSSGMKVRLAFAVAAHLEPEILIVDEVLAVGDAEFQKKCLGKMQDVSEGQGRTVLFVSHNMKAVAALCSRAVLLKDGGMAYNGGVDATIEQHLAYSPGGNELVESSAVINVARDNSKSAQILSVALLEGGGKPSVRHSLTQDIVVKVDFVVNVPHEDLVVCCRLYNRLAEVLLVTTESDQSNHLYPGERAAAPKSAGMYRAELLLSGPLLNEGVYEVEPMLITPRVAVHDSIRGIRFQIDDHDSFASCIFQTRRRGEIVPLLPWKVMETTD
jgi:lipopolysaccharide transport system ATP-binding protein